MTLWVPWRRTSYTSLAVLLMFMLVSPAGAFIEGGGGYVGPTKTFTTNELIAKGLAVREGDKAYRFSKDSILEFSYLGELEWVFSIDELLDTIPADAIAITEVVSPSPERKFRSQVRLRGDAVLEFDPKGTATVTPKSETEEIIKTLIAEQQRTKGQIYRVSDQLQRVQDTVDRLSSDLSESRREGVQISGFLYGALAMLGTGLIGYLVGLGRAGRRSKRAT